MTRSILAWLAAWGLVALLLMGCRRTAALPGQPQTRSQGAPQILRLATTTSTADSGLLAEILPDFEKEFGAQVDVVAVGTGQALAIGARGDADVVLVHARVLEDEFVAAGHALARYDVMYNDFVIVGPPEDPAGIRRAQTAAHAFTYIAAAGALFASRGDDSGTHTKERSIWADAGLQPGSHDGWYSSLGQGMGNTLVFANERGAYTLADRGTFLSMQDQLPRLVILFGGDNIGSNPDPGLYNPYGVLPVNPQTHPGVNAELAMRFIEWLTSAPVQERIAQFGVSAFGQPLFYPSAVSGQQ